MNVFFVCIIVLQIIVLVKIICNMKKYEEKRMVSYRGLVWIPWAISVGFVFILVIMNLVGTNKAGKELLLLNICSLLVSVLVPLIITVVLNCWTVEFKGDCLAYRSVIGEIVVPYSQITAYGYDKNAKNLYLYIDTGKKIKISDTVLFINMCDCAGVLNKHGVKIKLTPEHKNYELYWPWGYRLLMYTGAAISIVATVGIIMYCIWWGLFVAIPCLVLSSYYSMQYTNYKIIIEGESIRIRKGFQSITYTWKDLKYVSWPSDGNMGYLQLYFPEKTYKVESVWKNFWVFEQEVEKRCIKWK